MTLCTVDIARAYPEIVKVAEPAGLAPIVVGGSAALAYGMPVATSDLDVFILLPKGMHSLDARELLTAQFGADWHHDDFWDSHANMIAGAPVDFRLIAAHQDAYADFSRHRETLTLRGERICVRAAGRLEWDALDSARNHRENNFNTHRIGHYLERAELVRNWLAGKRPDAAAGLA
jgi:hypothetical protein